MPLRRILTAVARVLRRRDLSLHAAAVTFYGAIALVPVILLIVRLAALLAGRGRLTGWGDSLVTVTPDRLGADRAVRTLLATGLALSWGGVLAALIPATLYGEGLRRAFVSLAAADELTEPRQERLRGWRGRALLLPVLALGPVLLVLAMATLPATTHLLRRGGWASVSGLIVSFLTGWILLSVVLVWLFRVLAPDRLGWLPVITVGSFTAANLSGFLHGFLLFWALPLNIGYPFGGLVPVGDTVAVLLWLYLLHTVTLVGYVCCRQLDRYLHGRSNAATHPPQAASRE